MKQDCTSAITAFFLTLEGVLYLAFLTLDLLGRNNLTIPLKYTGLLLCLAFSLLQPWQGGDRWIPLALAFTAGADSFLLVRNDHYTVGVGLFLVVQLCYLLRLWRRHGGLVLPVRMLLPLLSGCILYGLGQFSWLNLLVLTYFSQLVISTVLAWRNLADGPPLFALGLTLFCCCDLCVGLFNLALPMPVGLHAFASVGMWFFYLPSQVLLSLSARPQQEVSP